MVERKVIIENIIKWMPKVWSIAYKGRKMVGAFLGTLFFTCSQLDFEIYMDWDTGISQSANILVLLDFFGS